MFWTTEVIFKEMLLCQWIRIITERVYYMKDLDLWCGGVVVTVLFSLYMYNQSCRREEKLQIFLRIINHSKRMKGLAMQGMEKR